MTSSTFVALVGWIPAIIFPLATFIQLIKIVREKTAEGVSLSAWILFGFANISLYIYTEKYFALQSIVGMLGTTILNFIVVGLAFSFKRNSK